MLGRPVEIGESTTSANTPVITARIAADRTTQATARCSALDRPLLFALIWRQNFCGAKMPEISPAIIIVREPFKYPYAEPIKHAAANAMMNRGERVSRL